MSEDIVVDERGKKVPQTRLKVLLHDDDAVAVAFDVLHAK
jgi:hypothetical protein